jgi:P-type Cu+ transporter
MIQVVREGLSRRAPVERFATHLLGYFVPVSTLLAILTWVIWMSLGLTGVLPDSYLDIRIGGWREYISSGRPIESKNGFLKQAVWSLRFSIAVFVVACPCGIGLAAPTALFVGSGLASKFGILARGGGEAFQEMAQVDTIVFDKTGTLTEGGTRRVSDAEILPLGDNDNQWNPQLVFGIAVEIESLSTHPFAVAIRNYCRSQMTMSVEGTAFEEKPGLGIRACFPAHRCTAIIGNEAWMIQHGVSMSKSVLERLHEWKNDAKSVVLLAIRQETDEEAEPSFKMAAIFAVNDPLRPEARHVVAMFRRWGMDVWMISGDNPMTAKAVAREAGIPLSNVLGGVLPHEKVRIR